MLLCCCTSKPSRNEEDTYLTPSYFSNFHSKEASPNKGLNRILIEFIAQEARLGLRDVECLEIIEKALLVSC